MDFKQKYHEPEVKEPSATDVPTPPLPHAGHDMLVHEMQEAIIPLQHAVGDMKSVGLLIAEALHRVERIYEEPFQERVQIGLTVFHLKLHGRHYSQLMVGSAQTVTVMVPGIGYFTRNLSADWNELDYPEGTELSAANPFPAIYQTSNFRLTNAG